MINKEDYFYMRYKYYYKGQKDKNMYAVQTPINVCFLSRFFAEQTSKRPSIVVKGTRMCFDIVIMHKLHYPVLNT